MNKPGQFKPMDIAGLKFGRLTALYRSEEKTPGGYIWVFRCDCGSEVRIKGARAKGGYTKSCGCFNRDEASRRARTHGLTKSPEYKSWSSMRTRCLNPKSDNYHSYGGRGISICSRWGEFESFLKDMGPRPSGHSLDRIDVNGDYEPSNCRWSNHRQQAKNRRRVGDISTVPDNQLMEERIRRGLLVSGKC